MLTELTHIVETINRYAWGIPSIVLLVGTGIYLTFKLRFIQFRCFKQSFKLTFGRQKNNKPGQISRFQALATALSGTIGTGNIAGVATAITMGGPGAMFWMWVTALVGMATKFASCTLAVKYRQLDPKSGHYAGGPMYTLKHGLRMPKLGFAFALFALIASFGIGNTVQANSIVGGLNYILPHSQENSLIIGIVLAVLVGVVILGGVKRIAHVASITVPFMAVTYCAIALLILAFHIPAIPHAFASIFKLAVTPHALGGGALGATIQYGVARGVFSNEAGLGSAAMVHAAAKTEDPVQQGLVAMMGPFIDTIVVCTMTGLVIVIAGNHSTHLQGAALSAYAFQLGLAKLGITDIGSWVVAIGLVIFAYTTLIAWSYYGDRCALYMMGHRAILPYRIVFTLMVIVGATLPLHLVWQFADIANILMAIPNLIAVIALAGVLKTMCSPKAALKETPSLRKH